MIKEDIPITYICPKNKIDSFLKFEKNSSRRGIRLGYNDTMKKYHKLDGNLYTFKLNNLDENINKYKDKYLKKIKSLLNEEGIISKTIIEHITLKNLFKDTDNKINEIIEKIGYLLDIDDSYIYNINKYNKIILNKFKNIKYNLKEIEENIEKNKLKTYLNNKIMVKYLYELIKNKKYNDIKKMYLLFDNEFLMSVYILIVEGE